ncbi:uncharacterized protein [Diadema setosum]|uniref:uncharacterized protein n=1 Tax=Diadema setosum TaxID=31175 RepID=UPI003B3AC8BE
MAKGNKTVLYSGNENIHTHGVGIILGKEASRALIEWTPVDQRIITARLCSRHGKTTIIQAYAPTENSEDDEKDEFYGKLQDVIDHTPSHDVKLLIGDFNAQISKERKGLEQTIGPHGTASTHSDNGVRFISFCTTNGLSIGNTYFQHKLIHKKTWRAPGGKTLNEIDYICINSRWRSSLSDVKVRRGGDVGSDHYLLVGTLRLRLKRRKEGNTAILRPIAVENLANTEVATKFKLELTNRFAVLQHSEDVEEEWHQTKTCINEAAEKIIGKRRGTRRQQWISQDTWKLIDERKQVKSQRDQSKTEQERNQQAQIYSDLDVKVKKQCKRDKKAWLQRKAQEAQRAANRNDSRSLYRIVKELSGTGNANSIPIKNKEGKTLASEEEQNARWVEHFQEVLNQPDPPSLIDFSEEDVMEPLDLDTGQITEAEVLRAIKALKNGKAAGIDNITPELLKYSQQDTTKQLTHLFSKIWTAEQVPEDWSKGVIVKLPKKGVRQGCTLSPLLFLLTIDFVMRKVMNKATFGVKWNDNRLTDLDFADDLALLGDTAQSLQKMTDSLTETAAKVGLRVSSEKTKVMSIHDERPMNLQVNHQTAEEVSSFTYLGSIVSKNGDTELDIICRLGKARSVFQRLKKIGRGWGEEGTQKKLMVR